MRKEISLLLTVALAMVMSLPAIADKETGYKSGVHRYEYRDGSVYVGSWKNYKPCGKGKLTTKEGDVWEGKFLDGLVCDTVEVRYHDGSFFRGVVSPDGRRTGILRKGTPVDYTETEIVDENPQETGTRFVADSLGNFAFSYFLRNGRRVYKSIRRADGSMLTFYPPYAADENGRMRGRIVHKNYIYDGQVKEHNMTADGEGVCEWTDGGRFEGEWREGKTWEGRDSLMHFYGVDGGLLGIYTGGESRGLLNGEGRYEFANGDVYVGMFQDGKFQGHGVYTWATNGQVYDGEWIDDEPCDTNSYAKEPEESPQQENP